MRGSGWLIMACASIVWIAAIGVPMAAAISLAILEGEPHAAAELGMRHVGALWRTGMAWAIGVGTAAALLGWAPGRLLRTLLTTRPALGAALGLLFIVPAALPAYLGTWCWWQLAPPDSAVGAWIVRSGHLPWLRQTILALGLVGWSWPLAAWAVAGLGFGRGDEVEDTLRLDGVGRWGRLRLAWFEDRGALVVAAVATGLFAFGNTTAFDLTLVRSFGFELRTIEVRGGGVGTTVRAAWPAVATALVGIGLAWAILAGRRGSGEPSRRVSAAGVGVTVGLLVTGVVLPVLLLLLAVPLRERGADFVRLYRDALVSSVAMALLSASLAAVVAFGAVSMVADRRRWVRLVADAMLLGWAVAATVPATVVAVAMIAAYNRGPFARTLYDSPVIVALGHLACFGLVAALLGRQAARSWPDALRDQAALDGTGSAWTLTVVLRPALIAASLAAAALVAPMSLGEVVLAGRLQPPGHDSIASALLNAVHYQRPETVMIGALALLLLALTAGAVAPGIWLLLRRVRPTRGAGLALAPLALVLPMSVLPGCSRADADSPVPIPARTVFGRPGVGSGQFDYPRAIAVDRRRERIYVIDKTARIQRFAPDGTLELVWRMPEWEDGKPVGLAVAPDGSVWVADTHYYRVVVFEPTGVERFRFGSFGFGPGEFVYPTAIAFGADGRVYVGEYGGHDRIQIFDRHGQWLGQFGHFGSGPEGLSRPQGLAFSADGAELFIADSCNHRIVVTDPEGRVLRTFGRIGAGVGELAYPYGVEILSDGTVLVVEFGNARMQRFSPDGRPLGMWGGIGFDVGRVRSPWGVAATSATIFVLDSGNHRVQAMRRP